MAYRSDEYYTGVFMGRKSLNEYVRVESLEFPVGAFKDFLRAEGMPMPDFWKDGPGTALKPAPAAYPVTAAPSQQDECREVESAPVAAAPDDMEVVPGVTVGNLRAMIDEKSSAYCPRLLAAIQTKIALMPRESVLRNDTVYERYAKTESVSRLKEALQKPPLPSRMEQKCSVRLFLTTPECAVFLPIQ